MRYTVRARLAQAYAAGGDLDRAERELTDAGDDLERWRAGLVATELRRYAFAATTLGEYDPQGPAASVIAALAHGGRAEAAFTLAERRRARTLADRLTQADALSETNAALAAHRDRPAGAADIAAAMPDEHTALLEYVAGSEGAPTTLFVVTRAGITARLLPPADSLARPIERFAALLESGQPADALARSLGRSVLGPGGRRLAGGDHPAHHRPGWSAAPRGLRRAPAAERHASRWNAGRSGSRRRPQSPRCFGGPPTRPGPRGCSRWAILPFRRSGPAPRRREADLFRGAFDAAGGLPRLAASGDEARDVARFAPESEVRLRSDASEAWLKRTRIDGFRVIHLATHALVDEGSLARTALALAPGAGEDGFLSPADLSALKLRADLVVLSACRTAGGVMVSGEGLQGLTSPLLEAGARAVIATQWRISDRNTVRLVHDLYDALARGAPLADALRSAKLAAVRRGAPPSEWAGFTVVGDPLVRIPLREPPRRPWPWIGGAIVVIVLALAARRVARRRFGVA